MRFRVLGRTDEVIFRIQKKLYPLELLQGAAYVLTDRCVAYVSEGRGYYEVTLEAKAKTGPEGLRALGGDFVNEVLNQVLRQRLLANNRVIVERILGAAFTSARGQETAQAGSELDAASRAELDRLVAEAEAETSGGKAADPRGTLQTWEERHGRPRVA